LCVNEILIIYRAFHPSAITPRHMTTKCGLSMHVMCELYLLQVEILHFYRG